MGKMHERNIYNLPPDFIKLSEQYENFGKHVTVSSDGKGHLNFKDPEAVRELTYTLLKHDFGLLLDIPLDRLIPTVPLRLNYILWIEDLLKECSLEQEPVKGIDIGCGASCIYPLLGTKLNNWNFIASEPDGLSYRFAQKNIEINKLNSKIILTEGNSDTLLKDAVEGNNQYDFCMCNPPFFSDREEALGFKSRTDKRMLPHSVCTATDGETITEGGEVAFVKRIISESTELRHSVRWYTSMLGKKSSLKALNRYLTELKIPFVTHTIFQQGKTTRWGIAWSFFKRAKHQKKSSPVRKVNPLPFAFVVSDSEVHKYSEEKYKTLSENAKVKLIFGEIEKLFDELEVKHTESSLFNDHGDFDHICIAEASKNTWSHQRQKRRLEKRLKMLECGSFHHIPSDSVTVLEAGCETLNGDNHGTWVEKIGEGFCSMEHSREFMDSGSQQIAGHKRQLVSNQEKQALEVPIFRCKIKVSVNRESDDIDLEPVRVEVFCLEGNRESLHQLFMFLRNRLNGIQKSPKKK